MWLSRLSRLAPLVLVATAGELSPAFAAPECIRAVAELRALLDRAPPAVSLSFPKPVSVPSGKHGAPLPDPGPILTIDERSNWLGRRRLTGAAHAELRAIKGPIYVAADVNTPTAAVVAAVEALTPEAEVRILIASTPAAVQQAENRRAVFSLLQGACGPVRKVFSGSGDWQFFRRALPEAVAACRCESIDVERIGRLLVQSNDIERTRYGYLSWPPALRARADRSASWRDVVEDLDRAAPASARAEDIVASATVRFASGQATLPADAQQQLQFAHDSLSEAPVLRLRIEGFCDATEPRALCLARAEAVRDVLVQNGIAATRIDTVTGVAGAVGPRAELIIFRIRK